MTRGASRARRSPPRNRNENRNRRLYPETPAALMMKLTVGAGLCSTASRMWCAFGAFSEPAGQVRIDWSDDGSCLVILWCEQDGPKVAAPGQHNFGSKLIVRMLRDIGGNLEPTFAETGYCYRISLPTSNIHVPRGTPP
jgi:hypothetical protein